MEITANFEEILFSQKRAQITRVREIIIFRIMLDGESTIIGPHYITKNYELCVVLGLDVS